MRGIARLPEGLSRPARMGGGLAYWQRMRSLFGSDLLGYWPLWETGGSVAKDVSGNGRDLTYNAVLPTYASVLTPGKKFAPVYAGNAGQISGGADVFAAFPMAAGALSC